MTRVRTDFLLLNVSMLVRRLPRVLGIIGPFILSNVQRQARRVRTILRALKGTIMSFFIRHLLIRRIRRIRFITYLARALSTTSTLFRFNQIP